MSHKLQTGSTPNENIATNKYTEQKTETETKIPSAPISLSSSASVSSSSFSSSPVCAPLCANTACKNYTGSPCRLCECCCFDVSCAFQPHVCAQIRAVYFPAKTSAQLIFTYCYEGDIARCENINLRQALLDLLEETKPLSVQLPTPSYAKNDFNNNTNDDEREYRKRKVSSKRGRSTPHAAL